MSDLQANCLCNSGIQYEQCCLPFHKEEKFPGTAKSLVRSRFTAYAMRNQSYLLKTWELTNRPEDIDFSKEEAEWIRLEIIKTKKGEEKDNKGVVEFKAYYILNGNEHVLNEVSRFKKITGRWMYLDGLVKSVSKVGQQTNQGKNARCACGSGKKFKRCCGK